MRNALRTLALAFCVMMGFATSAWATYCPVTPKTVFTDIKNEPTALYHGRGGGAAMDQTCTEAVAEARRRGWQLPNQAQFQTMVAVCGTGCTPWSGWRTLAAGGRQVRVIPQPRADNTYVPAPASVPVAVASAPQPRVAPRQRLVQQAVGQPRRVKTQHTYRARGTVKARFQPQQPSQDYICASCRDQNGNRFVITRNGAAYAVDQSATAYPVASNKRRARHY